MGGTCNAHGLLDRRVQVFGWEKSVKEPTGEN